MMEVENMNSKISKEEEEDLELPGFRFHPTDEELVGFYLRRKVDKRPIRLDLINHVDIYKFDPWDLPIKSKSSSSGEKEWYFFCKRGRKYKNSVRPNRVTRSGFWKATGIDRPIYSSGRECIGLKKSLVYYRGSAGKGTKTDWMMHEFRLPVPHDKSTKHIDSIPITQEAEVWTLCRILKRSASYRKSVPDWREMAAAKRSNGASASCSETCSVESNEDRNNNNNNNNNSSSNGGYISFAAPVPVVMMKQTAEKRETSIVDERFANHRDILVSEAASSNSTNNYNYNNNYDYNYMYGGGGGDVINEFLIRHADWEDLRSVVDCAAAASNPTLNY